MKTQNVFTVSSPVFTVSSPTAVEGFPPTAKPTADDDGENATNWMVRNPLLLLLLLLEVALVFLSMPHMSEDLDDVSHRADTVCLAALGTHPGTKGGSSGVSNCWTYLLISSTILIHKTFDCAVLRELGLFNFTP